MKVKSLRLRGIRCFDDTGDIELSPSMNLIVGQNNSGKSTLLRGISGWQMRPFRTEDVRPGSPISQVLLTLDEVPAGEFLRTRPAPYGLMRFSRMLLGSNDLNDGVPTSEYGDQPLFSLTWPNNPIVPFVANRKAIGYNENISLSTQSIVDGTFSNIYAKIDRVAAPGPRAHDLYRRAVEEIIGTFITTAASEQGKRAGYYYSDSHFVTLDQMGDGVAEIVALIVELSLAKDKVFLLEEPETNLHPRGLKSLLELVRESAKQNQFIIATHSNIVVRELGFDEQCRIFRLSRQDNAPSTSVEVQKVEQTASAHLELLRSLGYEFSDFHLHEGWLFLEESSAESIVREVLIPHFAPSLRGVIRTFSAGGASNVEPSVSEFQRLVTFVHLEPLYKDRLWVRVDGDPEGTVAAETIGNKFPYLRPRVATFEKHSFELYYPARFNNEVTSALSVPDKKRRQVAKQELLRQVLEWSSQDLAETKAEWEKSAAEPIEFLRQVATEIEET